MLPFDFNEKRSYKLRRSVVFIVDYEQISQIVFIVGFEQVNTGFLLSQYEICVSELPHSDIKNIG